MIEGTNLAHWIDSITLKTLFDSCEKEVVAKLNPAMHYYAGTEEPFPTKKKKNKKKKVISQ